jgi:L-asparagine transporter-like permease
VPALLVGGACAIVVCLNRDFTAALGIYYFAAALLFGLSYASLLVFRWRERAFPGGAFRCPAGPLVACALIVWQLSVAASIILDPAQRPDALRSLAFFAALALVYLVWKGVALLRRPPA